MASLRVLKKEIKAVLEDLMEEVISFELYHPEKKTEEVEKLIAELLVTYDDSISKLCAKPAHKKEVEGVRSKLDSELPTFVSRVNSLWQ